jgi:exonuclease SbcC
MRLQKLRIKDIGRLGSERVLDLDGLPDGLIAITGENGDGKTTLLECSCPGALYRTLPSRSPGGLVDVARGKKAIVEATYLHDGHTFRALHLLNGDRRVGEAHLYCDDEPYAADGLVSNGKVKVFDKLVVAPWPSWDVVAASRFWTQKGSGSWAKLDAPARRALLRELLGLGRWQRIADSAKGQLRIVEADVLRLEEVIARLESQAEKARAWGVDRDKHAALREKLRPEVESMRAACVDMEQELEAARLAESASRAAEQLAKRVGLEQAAEVAEDEYSLSVTAEEDARAANGKAKDLATEARAFESEAIASRRVRDAGLVRIRRIETEVALLEESQVPDAPDQETARERLTRAQERADGVGTKLRKAGALSRIVTALAAQLRDAERRVGMLDGVPCGGDGEFSACHFLGDAVKTRDALPGNKAKLAEAEDDAEAAAVDPDALPEARAAVEAARLEIDTAAKAEQLRDALTRARAGAVAARNELPPEVATEMPPHLIGAIEHEAVTIDALARADAANRALYEKLKGLRMRLEGLPSLVQLQAAASDEGWTGRPVPTIQANLTAARREAREVAGELEQATRDHVVAGRLADEHAVDNEELEKHRADVDKYRADAERLRRIQHAAGPRGVQAVLVDASGPAISATANELLAVACGWPRFRLEIRTTKETRDGKGQRDVMECIVHDAETGISGKLENTSGGEIDMLKAGLAMGVAAHHSEQTGMKWETGWADESDSALTPGKATGWVAMMRVAAKRLGIRQLLIISHNDHVQRACDAVIDVNDLEVEALPFELAVQ